MIAHWPGPEGEEYTLAFESSRQERVLVLPPFFDEANKTRHFLTEVMRRLDGAGVDSFLPDLPGCNESRARLETQSLNGWRRAATAAGEHFAATHVLAIRAGALIAPILPGWSYAGVAGSSVLRTLLRARILTSREAGTDETFEGLMDLAKQQGLELSGYRLSPSMLTDLLSATPAEHLSEIRQSDLGGSSLWLRAEPSFDAAQADALAALIVMGLRA